MSNTPSLTKGSTRFPNGSKLARSTRFRDYLIGIGALTGLILGLLAQFKGEPMAERTWGTLREQVNKQSDSINELYTRMEVYRAVQEARMASDLEHELEELQRRYDALEAEKDGQEGAEEAKPRCPEGRVMGADGACRAVPRTVATKVKRDEKHAGIARKQLGEERRKRLEAEIESKEMMEKLMQYDSPEQGALKALPKSLEEASK